LRRLVVLGLLALLVAAPLAHADADPASDWLLQRFVFIPPDAGVSGGDVSRLTSELQSLQKKGYTLHVATIPTRYDMGAVTVLFNRPHEYAPFLSQELRFLYKGRVLVVMKNGYAIARDGKRDPTEQKVVDALPLPTAMQGPPLAAATERAIRRLAAHSGFKVTSAPISAKGGSSTTSDRIEIVAGAAVLVAVVLAFSYWRRRGAALRRPSR